ncbi:MAG: pyrroline-5-carboxylate reductase [Desulfatitalea sp.]|nr:pyrroline-5-carboxylate reductase [Desulfatitalea sp.]
MALENMTIGFIGAGNMGEALINGLLGAGLCQPDRLFCADVRAERLRDLEKRFGIQTRKENLEVIRKADIVLYAVKPQGMAAVLQETAGGLDESKVIISIAAGVPLATLSACSAQPLRLVRAMPNVCVAVKAGATAIVGGPHTRKEDLDLAAAIFNSVGRCIVVTAEHLLDGVTGLSGSGPAYVFMVIEALADGGVKTGLTRPEALLLAAQTVLGAARMQLETGTHPGQLKDMVTSPAGTTIAALHALEKGGLRATLIDAVEAATERARQLGLASSAGK